MFFFSNILPLFCFFSTSNFSGHALISFATDGSAEQSRSAQETTCADIGAQESGSGVSRSPGEGPSSTQKNVDLNLQLNPKQAMLELLSEHEALGHRLDEVMAGVSSIKSKAEFEAWSREFLEVKMKLTSVELG